MRPARHSRVLFAAIGALLLGGCDSAGNITGGPRTEELVAFTPLESSALVAIELNSGIRDRRRLVIRDDASWTAVWSEAVAPFSPRPPVPAIDFTREMLILASMGERLTGGYSIGIEMVVSDGRNYDVFVLESVPGPSCGVHNALTAPLTVVRVPRTSGSVAFEELRRTIGCD